MARKCKGCGAVLQSENEAVPGFIPESVLEDDTKKDIICKRCFRIKNYGSYEPVDITDEDYLKEVKKVVTESNVVLFIIDLIDFDSSMDKVLLDIVRTRPIIAAVNKIDLLPDKKHPSEIANWVKKRFAEYNIIPFDIAILSVKDDYGVNGIVRKLSYLFPDGAKAAVVGVTNVGKSSLINGIIGGKSKVTVSKYPGTTLKALSVAHPDKNHIFIDTPGLIPKGRVSDMVCEECNLKLVPSKEISRKTFKIKAGKVLMLGGLVNIQIINTGEFLPIFQAFAAKDVTFHQTNEIRAAELIERKAGEFVMPPCEKCRDVFYERKFERRRFTVNEGEELFFKGLGWISVRRGPLEVEVTLPEGMEAVAREALVAPKKY
jgi:hypothetical protein